MNKQDFLDSYIKYGISEKDVCKNRIGIYGDQLEKVCVIAPLHKAEWYKDLGANVTQLSFGYYPAYKITYNGFSFNFISTQIGACNADEIFVSLAFSNCEKVIFTGSVGSLKSDIKIGDILLPNYSRCGDGATRYYTKNEVSTNDAYKKKYFPTKSLQNKLIEYMNSQKVIEKYRFVNNFSIDTIVGQFLHIDEFLACETDVIEMETASIFCLAEMLQLDTVAILNVSDSTQAKKSLLSGRSKEELDLHYLTEKSTVPKLVLGFIESIL